MSANVVKYSVEADRTHKFIRSLGLTVRECGTVQSDTVNTNESHFSHYYRFNYVRSGTVYYQCCNKITRIGADSLIYLPPNIQLTMDEGSAIDLIFINFELQNLNRQEEMDVLLSHMMPRHFFPDHNHSILLFCQRILEVAGTEDAGRSLMITNLFESLFLLIIRGASSIQFQESNTTFKISGTQGLLNQALAYIQTHLHDSIKAEDVAASIGISTVYLYKIFRMHMSISPQQYILQYKIEASKNYLNDRTTSIKIISEEFGFNSSSHYSSTFKKLTGISPQEYRDQLFNKQITIETSENSI